MTETFGARLLGARKRAGLTQTQLGQSVGVAISAITDWENDKRLPEKVASLIRLSEVLNVSIDYLLTGRKTAGVDYLINELQALVDDAKSLLVGGQIEAADEAQRAATRAVASGEIGGEHLERPDDRGATGTSEA